MRKADNLPPSCAVVMKSGNRNLMEPSGTLRACNGTALPFYYINYAYPVEYFDVMLYMNLDTNY